MKKFLTLILTLTLMCSATNLTAFAKNSEKHQAKQTNLLDSSLQFDIGNDIKGAYLIESETGKVLYSKNEYEAMIPASVTKIMTLLLVAEAIADGYITLEQTISVSEYAASKGGSQVFLKAGERISVLDLLKSTIIASANDSAVALAELVAGSEAAFVKKMNKRAIELGLKNTNFENATGLDDTTTNHYSCPSDIAKMSRELIKHEIILKYSSVWQDSIRNGDFILTNTNRLVRYYDGCNGLKTGSTDKAGYCISASAKRGNMQLIAVIMGAPTRDIRNNAARELLDFGFANYSLYEDNLRLIEEVPVTYGKTRSTKIYSNGFKTVVPKESADKIALTYDIPQNLCAPIQKGATVGKIIYSLNGEQIGFSDIYVDENIEKIKYGDVFIYMVKKLLFG